MAPHRLLLRARHRAALFAVFEASQRSARCGRRASRQTLHPGMQVRTLPPQPACREIPADTRDMKPGIDFENLLQFVAAFLIGFAITVFIHSLKRDSRLPECPPGCPEPALHCPAETGEGPGSGSGEGASLRLPVLPLMGPLAQGVSARAGQRSRQTSFASPHGVCHSRCCSRPSRSTPLAALSLLARVLRFRRGGERNAPNTFTRRKSLS